MGGSSTDGRRARAAFEGPRRHALHRRTREEHYEKIVLAVFTSLVIAASAADVVAQTAGVSVTTTELREVATGWSAKKQILGESV